MSKKPLKITTDFIEIKLNRGTGLLSMQGSVFIGLLALLIASDSQSVHVLCIVFMVMDIIFFLVGFMSNLQVSEVDENDIDTSIAQDAEVAPEVIVEHEQSESSIKQTEEVIRNKVQVPTQAEKAVVPDESVPVQSDKKGGDSLAGKSQAEINAFWDAAFASGEDEE